MTTQKEWELETRIKYLEGTGLQFLYDEYCSKIDQIFQRADKRLEDVRDVPKAKPKPKPKPAHSDEPYVLFDQRMDPRSIQWIYGLSEQGLQRGVIGMQGDASLARAGAAARGAFGSLF